MQGLIMCILSVLTLIVLLSFLAPRNADGRFWKLVMKGRESLDLLSYWLINIIAVCSFGSAIVLTLFWLFKGGA